MAFEKHHARKVDPMHNNALKAQENGLSSILQAPEQREAKDLVHRYREVSSAGSGTNNRQRVDE